MPIFVVATVDFIIIIVKLQAQRIELITLLNSLPFMTLICFFYLLPFYLCYLGLFISLLCASVFSFVK